MGLWLVGLSQLCVLHLQPPGGSHNLWDLVAVIMGQDDSLLPQSYGKSIMHMKHLVRFKTVSPLHQSLTLLHSLNQSLNGVCLCIPQSEAQELTIVKMSKFGGGIGAPSKEERLRSAADIHLSLGQTQRYCELMVELGEVRLFVYALYVSACVCLCVSVCLFLSSSVCSCVCVCLCL